MLIQSVAGSNARPLRLAAGGLALGSAALLLYWNDPTQHSFYPRCVFFLLTGLYCPGCGATRALHELLHANLVAAFRLNPLLLLLYLPVLGYVVATNVVGFVRREAARDVPISTRGGWAIAGLILAFWLVRNTSWYPFH